MPRPQLLWFCLYTPVWHGTCSCQTRYWMERTQTITGGVASFGNLTVSSAPGSGDTLATALTVTPTASIACGGLPMGSKCIFGTIYNRINKLQVILRRDTVTQKKRTGSLRPSWFRCVLVTLRSGARAVAQAQRRTRPVRPSERTSSRWSTRLWSLPSLQPLRTMLGVAAC